MPSPKLRKPSVDKFWELFIKLPFREQAALICDMYRKLPDYHGEFVCIDMRSLLAEIERRKEAQQQPPEAAVS